MFDLRKQLEDKLQLAPATALTKAKTVSVAPARTVNTSNFVVKQPTIKMAQPKQPTLQIQQTPVRQNFPVAQQNSPTQKSLQIGTPKTIRLTARPRVRTIEEIRMEPLFKQGKSFEDIQQQAGFSSREVKDYADKYHQNYGDKGLVQNVARETGKFVGGMVKAGAGIVTRPIHDASDLNRKKGEAELQQINRDYRSGVISPEAAMERAQTLASKYTTQKAYQDKDGWIRVGTHNPVEFAGNIAQQGIDTYSVLPTSGAVTTAGARAAGKAGMTKTTGLLSKASEFMTGGAGVINQGSRLAPQANKLAQGLTKVGMNSGLADDVSKAVVSNAVQSGVYGTAQTGADIASGRGVSPESLLMNYGADFVMGTGMELGTGALLRSGAKAIDSVPTAKKMADSHPQILGMLAETDKLFEQKNALLSRGMSPNSAAVVGVNKAIKAAGAEYNRVYKQVYDAAKLEMQRGFIAGPLAGDFSKAKAAGQVFNGVDGKPRFEVDDSGAKIKNPNGNTLGDVLDHPELYKNYPELKSTRVSHIEGKDSSFGGSEIRLGKQATDKQGSLLHETQHAIQDKEKFASGGGPEAKDFNLNDYTNTPAGKAHLAENVRLAKDKDPSLTDIQAKNLAGHKTRQEATYSQYRNLAGEAEARAVQARMDMPMSERYVKGTKLYRATKEEFDPSRIKTSGKGLGTYATAKKTYAEGFLDDKRILEELNLNPDAKILKQQDIPKELMYQPFGELSITDIAPNDLQDRVAKYAIKNGFDAVDYAGDYKNVIIVSDRAIAKTARPRSTFYDSLDVPKEDLIVRNGTGKAMSVDGRKISETARSYAAESTPDQIMKDTVDYWYNYDKQAKGGQMIGETSDNYRRITEHSDFYSKFYKENKKRPTKADYEAETARQLEQGGGSLIEKDIADAYALAKSNEVPIEAYRDVADYSAVYDSPVLSKKAQDIQRAMKKATPEQRKMLKSKLDAERARTNNPKGQQVYNQAHTQPTPKPEAPQPTVAPVRKPKTAFEKSLEQAGLAPSQPLASKPKGKIATDVSASAPVSRKVSESTAIQSSKKESRPSQKVQMSRTRQETQGRPSQRQGRETPSPDSKVLTDRTFSDNTPPIDTKQYIKELSKEQSVAGKGKFSAGEKAADFKEKFIDDLSPIEDRLNKAIKAGAEVDPKDHITYQLDRSRRSEGVTQAYMNDNDLSKIIQEVPNPKEFDQYLIARHAKELDPKITTGRNKAKDAALVKQLEGKYGEYAKRVYAYNQKLLDTSVEYGLISKELAASLKKQYPEYVPLNRIFKEDELGMLQGNGKGSASISSQGVVKKLKGSERSVRSPLNSIIDKTRVVVEQGERNKAAQMLASYEKLPGNPFNLKEIKANETIGNRNTIAYLDNGKKRVFEVDKEIADAAKNMTRQDIGLWGRIVAIPARVLRAGATGVNAGFAGANVVKDVIGAAINSKHPIRIADPRAFGKALAAALHHNGKFYQELMREGVAGTSFDMYRNPLKSNIGEIRSQKNIGTRSLYNVTHPKQWYRTIENTIGRSEDFGRALQYYSNKSGFIAEGKNAGDAKILAADQARNNSTNFFRHGSYGKVINLAIPYWNAGVQGARIQTRRIAERPVQTLAKIGFVIAAPSAMIAVNNYSDENKRKVMDDIEDYEKDGNIIIVGDNARFNEKTGRWDGVTKIPVPPQHLGIHKSIQDAVKSAYTGADYDIIGNLGKITENYTTVDPTDGRAIANKYTPQGVKLIAEPMTNTNFFTGNKIVPDSQKNLPAADQFGEYTSGTAKAIGKLTNTSPRMIDNTIKTGGGGVGRSITKAIDDTIAADGGVNKSWAGASALLMDPVTKRFSGAQALSPTSKSDKQFDNYKKNIVQSDAYKNASQYDKQRMLNRLQNDLEAVAWNATGKSETKLTKKQKDMSENGFKLENYTNLDASANSTGKADTGWMDEYNAAAKDFSENSKNWTEIQRIGKEKELRTLEVKKNFSKDATRLYDMSERDIYAYLDRSDDKKASDYLNQIVAYGDKMVEAGLWSTNKLRDKYGNVQYKRGYTGSTGGGRSTSRSSSTRSSGSTAKKGKFDYKLYGFSSSPSGSGSAKDLYDLLKRATMKG